MSVLKKIPTFLLHILRYNKLKIFVCMMLCGVFLILLFPYDELGDLATQQLAQSTQGRVSLSYDKLGFHLFPPAVSLQKPRLQVAGFSALSMQQLKLAPLMGQLLMFRLAARVTLLGVFQSSNQKQASSLQADWSMQAQGLHQLQLQAKQLSLGQVARFLNLPVQPSALFSLNTELQLDPSFQTPPQGQLQLQAQSFHLPSLMITGIALPSIALKSIQVKGALEEKSFNLSTAELGQATDSLQAKLKGRMALAWPAGRPQPGAYDVSLNLMVKPSMAKDPTLALALSLLKKFGKNSPQGMRYLLKLSGRDFRSTPSMKSAASF